jgi:predicted GIY-YIG superfamily endonuclease
MGYLYAIDSPSGKRYIGITADTLGSRWRAHRAHAKRSDEGALQKAIRKYGASAMRVKPLVIANDYEYLKELERKAIAAFRCKVPHGYNMTDGGDGVLGVIVTEEGRKRRCDAQQKSFSDPVRRDVHRRSQQTPEIRKFRRDFKVRESTKIKLRKAMRLLWKDPNYIEKMAKRPHKPCIDDGLSNWQRHRLSDLAAYRKRKREYARTPAQRAKRAAYMRIWNARQKRKHG